MDYDVIIVGARVAGAILATRLGQLGHRVLLLEKGSFPSDTLSTSFFRAPALRVFEKIGVLEDVKSAAPHLRTLWNYIDGHVLRDLSKRLKGTCVFSCANGASRWIGSSSNA